MQISRVTSLIVGSNIHIHLTVTDTCLRQVQAIGVSVTVKFNLLPVKVCVYMCKVLISNSEP